MANVYIPVRRADSPCTLAMRQSATVDRFKMHALTEDESSADLFLIVRESREPRLGSDLRKYRFVRHDRERCFCFNEHDVELSILPGLYTSIGRPWHRFGRVITGCYPTMYHNEFIDCNKTPPVRDMMFIGAIDTNPVRRRLARVVEMLPPSHCLFVDTSDEARLNRSGWSEEQKVLFRRRYAEEMSRSRFVLCPRGWSPSTVRLFEVLRAGRVPVIISDAWVPPPGPAWDTFSVRVPESEIGDLPRRLAELSPRAAEMGRLARGAWEDWYAADVLFHRVVEWCLALQRMRRIPERFGRYLMWLELLVPINARNVVRDVRQRTFGR